MSRIKKAKIRNPSSISIAQKHEDLSEKKKKRNSTIMTAFVAFIMIASVMGYMWMNPEEIVPYNKFKFAKRDNGWYSKDFKAIFDFHPFNLEDIAVEQGIKEKISGTYMAYLSYDLNSSHKKDIARSMFLLNEFLVQSKNMYVLPGSLNENDFNISVIRCDNATSGVPVIIFEASNSTLIRTDKANENCIILSASTSADFARVKDRMIYALLGVMNSS